MLAVEFYKQRIGLLLADMNLLNKKKSRLGWLRLAVIASLIIAVYILQPYNNWYIIFVVVLLLVLFTRLVYADLKNKSSIKHLKYLIIINEDEVKAFENNYYHFKDGCEYIPKEHFYANDLDIFGHASVFQFINRTSSEMGSSTLADWLLNPARPEIITEKQAAIKELSAQIQWC